MERIELLQARIALYRRYLREGVDGQIATAYLWLIRRDEIELAALAENRKKEAAPEPGRQIPGEHPPAHPRIPKDGC